MTYVLPLWSLYQFLSNWFANTLGIHMSRTGRGIDSKNRDVNANAKFSPLGDKIFILRVGGGTVVLVWFTNVLAEYVHALMIAENIELKQYFNLNLYPFANQSLS